MEQKTPNGLDLSAAIRGLSDNETAAAMTHMGELARGAEPLGEGKRKKYQGETSRTQRNPMKGFLKWGGLLTR